MYREPFPCTPGRLRQAQSSYSSKGRADRPLESPAWDDIDAEMRRQVKILGAMAAEQVAALCLAEYRGAWSRITARKEAS